MKERIVNCGEVSPARYFSMLVSFKTWVDIHQDCSAVFLHKFRIRVNWKDETFDLKINVLDNEVYILNEKEEPVKWCKTIKELKDFFEGSKREPLFADFDVKYGYERNKQTLVIREKPGK